MDEIGSVHLVGTGPGDPGLMTLRAAELLATADVVIVDALVNPVIVNRAPADAEVIRRSGKQAPSVEEIIETMVNLAREGKRVVRLKGGDPYVFGRGGEEAIQLQAAGIPFEVVPGVSSAIAAPCYAGIPLTHRGIASGFTVVTGHEDPTKMEKSVDWARIARAEGTKVLLMSLARLGEITARLIENGMAPDTPAALIRKGTLPTQQTLSGTLGDIAEKANRTSLTPPVVAVIGEVVTLREELGWFEKLPLFGQRVVVTRGLTQAGPLVEALSGQGAEVLSLPCIRIEPPKEKQPLLEAIAGLNGYDWLIFTSVNGVDAFFDYFFKGFQDLRDLGGVRLAAVGPATADRIRRLHLSVDVTPKRFVAKELAKAIAEIQSVENLRILLMRAEVATPELTRLLEDMGAIVDDIACYRTVAETEDTDGVRDLLEAEGADWVTFASASAVEGFDKRISLKQLRKRFRRLKIASIGPETSKALRARGVRASVEAEPHTVMGMVDGIVRASRAGA